MSDEKQFSQDLLEQILSLVESVIARMAAVSSADDLLVTEQGKLLLDAVPPVPGSNGCSGLAGSAAPGGRFLSPTCMVR